MKGILNSVIVKRVVFSMLILLAACSRQGHEAKAILPPAEMVRVLSDLYIVEEKVNRLSLRRDSAETVFANLKDRMFLKLGVPDSVFKKSIDYYMDHPDEMEQVYSALVDSLNLREQRATSTQPTEAEKK